MSNSWTPDTWSRTHPAACALVRHSLAGLGAHRQPALYQWYGSLSIAQVDQMERQISLVLAASGQELQACLRDLDAFNTLTPETENDAWYELPAAFTSMHLDFLLPGFAQRRLQRLCAHLEELQVTNARVLDVGSGCGRLGAMLLDQHAGWHATLVDRSPAATAYAAAYLRAGGLLPRAACHTGDLAQIPAPDHSFDVVIAAEVLEHAPEPTRSAAELMRVLKPGGWLCISLPINLDIAMHPTVFHTQEDILAFFEALPVQTLRVETVAPQADTDAITDVFPGFVGCLHATFARM